MSGIALDLVADLPADVTANMATDVLSQIDQLQIRYIAALDAKKMPAWLATFADDADAAYICTTAENVEANLPIALMLDDCHARLEDRVSFITKIWAGTYTDYRTRHFIQRTACYALGSGLFDVETNFSVSYTPADTGRAEIFATGVYLDRIRIQGGSASFLSKKAVTDNSVVERYVVFPL
jgi:3-phenylpropionate/cinnamic acid dioxygenase small subunit